MTIAATDIGYGYSKALSSRFAVFPSVIGPAVEVKYHNDLIGNGKARALEIDGERWFAGDTALLQSTFTISPRARQRDTDVVKILTLFALQAVGLGEGEVQLVTGLPVAWYDDREEQIEALTGQHKYSFNNTNCTSRISDVLVVPQPFGSFFRAIISADGQLTDREGLARRKVGVVDIGTHTSDYALSNALRYVEPKSGSIDVAMARVYELIQRGIEQENGRILSLQEAENVVRIGVYRDAGQEVDAQAIRAAALETVGRQILAKATELWGDGRDLDAILVTGGGGHAFHRRIQEQYAQARLVDGPQKANVEGFYRYGLRKFGG
jgi:plasmid segregation protein ParM